MSKTKLRTQLAAILRSGTLSSVRKFSTSSTLASEIRSPSTYTSLCPPLFSAKHSRTSLTFRGCEVFGNLQFPRRIFCSQSEAETKCWNCGAVPQTAPFLVCESCRSIQPVDQSVNYFQIFGLDKKYEIGDVNLEGKYKNWQKKLHPDLVHSKSEKERDYAAEQSARVIDAYRTLGKPLSRAIYVLKLEGVDVDEEETVSEPELLAEIMEIREAVEEASDSEALNQIKSQMLEKLKHWSDSFANAFRSCKFDEALECIRRMTYYERVNEEIVKKL